MTSPGSAGRYGTEGRPSPASSGRDGAGSDRHGAGSDRDGAGSDRDGAGSDRDGAGSVTPAEVLDALLAAGATVAVAESLTGGLLTAALTEPAGASKAVRGGMVVYATDLKATLAGVPVPLLDAEGPVSPDVAGALAAGARDRLGATYGLGVTGVAGPDRQGDLPAGTVYLGLAGPGGGRVRHLTLSGDRSAIRAATVDAALAELLAAVRAGSAELSA